jgi:nucleoside-diphosphate-sugar epimerase
MKFLVTGASGFVGTHLCARLLKEGHEVFALVRTPSKLNLKNERLTVLKGDLNTESLPWVSSLPKDLDICIHTAGLVHAYNTDEFYHVNADGTEFLVRNLKERFSHLQFMLISSLAAGGPGLANEKRNESDMDFPVSVYGKSKKKAEEILYKHAPREWSLSVIRPPMVIGPGDAAILDVVKMVKGKVVLLPGFHAREKLYSFVAVFDLIETISLISSQKKTGLFYSAAPHVISFGELIGEIKKQLKERLVIYFPMPLFLIKFLAFILNFFYRLRPHALRLTPDKFYEIAADNWTCDGSKSESELGQVYGYELALIIKETLADYKSRKWI